MFHRVTAFFVQAVLVAFPGMAISEPAVARNYAFLVGVSSYPNLQKRFQLAGPDNDVLLMKSVLQQMGVRAQDITALYSTGARRPTKANIIAGLRDLVARTTPEDLVFVYFAGHGSRQPAREGDSEEEDGLDEIFLPEDVGLWEDGIAAVERAITDNEIRDLIAAIRNNGTFVWAVFDSCHSGTMLRSVSRIKWRKVDPSALGIPANFTSNKSRKGRLTSPLDITVPASPPVAAPKDVPRPRAGKRGGYVAFYAAQSHQLAPELKMPPEAKAPVSHGLFTWQLARAMMDGAGRTYRQIGQSILQKYVTQGMRATTPLFEGTNLDTPLFGRKNREVARQWPVRRRGSASRRALFVPAGELQEVGKGTIFALLANVSDTDEQAIGYARAEQIDLFSARLVPVSYGGKAAIALSHIPRTAWARVIKPAFRFSLSVAIPRINDARTGRERRVARIIAGMVNGPEAGNGVQINWRKPDEPADIHLVFSPSRDSGMQQARKGCARNHLWFTDRTGALICSGSRANLSFRLQNPSADFDHNVRQALIKYLHAIGKVRNLEQMAARFRGGRFARQIKIKLLVRKKGEQQEKIVDQASRLPLLAGDNLRLDITNNSNFPVDLTILFVDSRFGIDVLFPRGGRTNRIAAKGRLKSIGGRVTADTLGLEGMIVIASKAATGSPVADFRFLAQKKLSRVKNVRSAGAPRPVDPEQGAIEDLFASAAFGQRKSVSTRSAGKRRKPVKTPFRSVAIKSLRWMVDQP